MRKYIPYILILIVLVGLSSGAFGVHASDQNPSEDCRYDDADNVVNAPCVDPRYNLLAPLPGVDSNFDPGQKNSLGTYLNAMIKIFIGLCAVLAVVMLVIGGIEYMTSELMSSKEHGRERMRNAVLGLLIALGAYVLLFTINPDLLETDLDSLTDATLGITPTTNSVVVKPASANCSIATSGLCAPSNLSAFGADANDASRICMVESGGEPAASSGGDRCIGGTQFSVGLFQINLIANGSRVRTPQGQSCDNLFEREDGSPIVGSNYINSSGSGRIYNCKAKTDQASADRLSACIVTLLNPQENIKVAAQLNSQRPNLQDWRYSDRAACGDEMFQQ